MKNIIKKLYIFTLLLLMAFNKANTKGYKVKRVVIDAGHGGKDAGALGKFSTEKNITLKIALQLGKIIQKNFKDVKVIYTRTTDKFVTIHERAYIANKNNADLLISIHCNGLASPHACGTETYITGLNTSVSNLRVVKRENAVIFMEDDYEKNYQGFVSNSTESHILSSVYQNAYYKNSSKLAQNIEYQFQHKLGRKSRGVKEDKLILLWKTSSPGVLVEVGFLSHREEEKYLNDPRGQACIATAIFNAFQVYKNDIETEELNT